MAISLLDLLTGENGVSADRSPSDTIVTGLVLKWCLNGGLMGLNDGEIGKILKI